MAPNITDDTRIAARVFNFSFFVLNLLITNKKGIIKIISSAMNCIIVETINLFIFSSVKTSKIGFAEP